MPYFTPHLANFPEDSKEEADKGRVYWTTDRESIVGLGYNRNLIRAADVPKSFAELERVLHEHGPVTMGALLAELRPAVAAADDAHAGDPDEAEAVDTAGLPALLDRLAGFHEVDDDDAPLQLLEAVLRRLRQRAVKDELDWLLESGDLSEAATARRNALIALTAELKNATKAPASSG